MPKWHELPYLPSSILRHGLRMKIATNPNLRPCVRPQNSKTKQTAEQLKKYISRSAVRDTKSKF